MLTAMQTLEQLRSDSGLEALCAQLGIDLLVVFGSAVREPEIANDIDLAYWGDGSSSVVDVINEFTDRFGEQLDILELRRAGTIARFEALARGRILVERQPGLFADLQMAAFGEFEDTRELRRLALEMMSS